MKRFAVAVCIVFAILGAVGATTVLSSSQTVSVQSDGTWYGLTINLDDAPGTLIWTSAKTGNGTVDIAMTYGKWFGFWTYEETPSAQYTQALYLYSETLY